MSDFTNFDELTIKKNEKKDDGLSDDDQSVEDIDVDLEKNADDDVSSDDDDVNDFESDTGNDDDEDPVGGVEGAYDEEAGEPNFTSNMDDDASVSSIDSDMSNESNGDSYFQKFNSDVRDDIISEFHAESAQVNYDEVNTLCEIVRNNQGNIIDPFHKTVPILSKFEKTRVLGIRAKQINDGAKPFVELNQSNYDGYVIACKELSQKNIPFIIRRPMPSGASEYWRLRDLEVLD